MIRSVRSKPDRIGLWFYEMVCLLGEKMPIMLYVKVAEVCSKIGESESTECCTELGYCGEEIRYSKQ